MEHLQKGLLPFMEQRYPQDGFIFWPDLAAALYATKTTALLEEFGVTFIAREENPPCVPQLRSIENCWGIIKQEVHRHRWKASTEQQLKDRIRLALRSMGEEVPRKLRERVPGRVRRSNQRGISGSLHW